MFPKQMTAYKPFQRQSGLSLIEIMIALVIAMLLLLGTMSMFTSNKRIYREQDQMGRLQENARFAIELLVRDIRMAGYMGCADDITEVTNDVNNSATATNILNFSDAVEGSENAANWLPSNSTDNVATMVAGSDGITVRYLDPLGIPVQPPYMPLVSAALQILANNALKQGEILAVSDCSSADIFQISNTNPDTSGTIAHNTGAVVTPGNNTGNLSKTYGANSQINRVISRRYFIGTGAGGGPSLFWSHIGGTEELIEGVENMQILYGEDTSADSVADEFRTAANVANWDNVTSIRVALLLRSDIDTNIEPNTNTYYLLDVDDFDPTPVADDRRRRRVVTTTVLIRNRDI